MRTAVVIPSIRNLDPDQLTWLVDTDIIVVDGGSFEGIDHQRVQVLSLKDQRQIFGNRFDILGHGSAACRNAGVWWAWKEGYDVVLNLDDDCWPLSDQFVSQYLEILTTVQPARPIQGTTGWVSTLHREPTPWYPRGFPAVDDYGLKLVQVAPIKSESLRELVKPYLTNRLPTDD